MNPLGQRKYFVRGFMSLNLILASTSRYRQALLKKLAIAFEALPPAIDEEREKDPSLSPLKLAEHLAELKARSLAGPGKLVLGGDQLVSFEGRILGKPGTQDRAIETLISMAGKTHELITAICLAKPDGSVLKHTDVTRLTFKNLTREQVEKIVKLDDPVDCAGAYKIEEHGIALVEKIESADFTAIQGLPLVALSKMLKECGLETP